MPRYKLIGNYGTFVVSKVITAADKIEAFDSTGICMDLDEAGWSIDEWPDGEEWEIIEL